MELKLNEINDFLQNKDSERMTPRDKEKCEIECEIQKQKLSDFLSENKDDVDPETIF